MISLSSSSSNGTFPVYTDSQQEQVCVSVDGMGRWREDYLGFLNIETAIRKIAYNQLQIKALSYINHSISIAWMTKCTFAESLQWPVQCLFGGQDEKTGFC